MSLDERIGKVKSKLQRAIDDSCTSDDRAGPFTVTSMKIDKNIPAIAGNFERLERRWIGDGFDYRPAGKREFTAKFDQNNDLKELKIEE